MKYEKNDDVPKFIFRLLATVIFIGSITLSALIIDNAYSAAPPFPIHLKIK